MRKRYLPFIELKKSVIITIILIITCIAIVIYGLHLYNYVMNDKTKSFTEVKEYITKVVKINHVNNLTRYHGDQLYYVSEITINNKPHLLFVKESDKGYAHTLYDASEFYSKEDILAEWESTCNNCEKIDSTIGMLEGNPVLEIKYLDQKDRFVYEHVLLEDKSRYLLTIDPSFN